MRKLAHYLKPYTALILICFGLLFGQAMCDLNLPNYMSDIVNVGIQQNGIEHASPEAVSRNGFELLRVFMTAEQKQTVSEHYRLVETDSAAENDDYEQLASWYPLLKEQDIYVRSEADGETLETLDEIFGQTTWTMVNFLQQMSEGQQTATDTSDLSDMDFSKIYAVLPQLAMLPEETFDEARRAAAETPESMQSQSGAMLAKLFYTELGMDIGGIQTRYILKTGLMMLLLTLLGAVATIAVTFLATRIAAAVAAQPCAGMCSVRWKASATASSTSSPPPPSSRAPRTTSPRFRCSHHGHPHALLCADHGRRRRCDGAAKERFHELDHRPGRHCAHRSDRCNLQYRHAQVQDDSEAGR